MPAVSDTLKSMVPQVSHHCIHGQPEYTILSRLCLLIGSVTTLSVIIFFSRRTICWYRQAQSAELELNTTKKITTWSPKSSSARWLSRCRPTYSYILGTLVPTGQGQGLFAIQAKDAGISTGKVVYAGIAPVGLGGSGEGSGRMVSGPPQGETSTTSTPATTSTSSCAVSTNLSDPSFAHSSAPGAQPLSFNPSAPLFPAADEHSRGHGEISRGPSPPSFMLAGAASGGQDAERAVEKGETIEAHMSTMAYSPFGYHMADDEHLSYATSEYYRSDSPFLQDASAYRRSTELESSRPPLPTYSSYGTHQAEDEYGVPLHQTPYYGASGSIRTDDEILAGNPSGHASEHEYVPIAKSSKTRGRSKNKHVSTTNKKETRPKGNPKKESHNSTAKSIPIPSANLPASSGSHSKRREAEEDGERHEFSHPSDNVFAFAPSSYPSTSPFLPPPPPLNLDDQYPPLDPTEVMFPGGFVADGGIRMVPTYLDEEDKEENEGLSHQEEYEDDHHHHHHDAAGGSFHEDVLVHGEMRIGGSAAYQAAEKLPAGGWKRHTRVYGGGICLACAEASGGGGYYGARVRPEDKRR